MDNQNDDFPVFGGDFDGFPRRLPEDCVEYSLFFIDSKLKSQRELLAKLEVVRMESVKLSDALLKDYIWQRDSFKLEVENGKGMVHLHGLTNYGDSVEDEWLIVYILRELSNLFPELWVKVVDTDGEFLLIEAATALPRWLNPEIADNRVWIHDNKLRIVPLSAATRSTSTTATSPISRSLNLNEALKILSTTPEILINSPLVEEEAFYRLRHYPAHITASLHYALITLPRKAAYLLHNRPASIAPAVEAFYLRDPVALRSLQARISDLTFPPEDLVTVSLRFTKVLYAQVKSQQFSPPPAWKGALSDALSESPTESFSDAPLMKKYTQLEMGMKLTSGFEMLLTDAKNEDHRVFRELQVLLDDLASGDTLPTDQDITKWKDVAREDDEAWLDINFEDFERELHGKGKDKNASGVPGALGPEPPSGFGDAKTQADLKRMVGMFEAFLNDENAGVDGADLDEMDFDDDDEYNDEDSEAEDKELSFDENEFARMMREMMGMPPDEFEDASTGAKGVKAERSRAEEISDSDGEEDEAAEMRKVMERMETELNEAGALNLDASPSKISARKGTSMAPSKSSGQNEDGDSDDESEGDANIDFNLAKNLLESFKSQAGMAGPGGNLMGMMGMLLPRDEGEASTSSKKT